MNQQEVIIGQQYAAIVPLKVVSQPSLTSKFYECRCTRCGSIIPEVHKDDILKYRVRCCPKCDRGDFTGMRFGRYTVLGLHHRTKQSAKVWECKCDCGNIRYIRGDGLVSGHVVSCGCFKVENRTINLLGNQFGRLTVIRKSDRRGSDGGIYWICKCSCPEGNIVEASSGNLIRGYVRSCGCLAKERSSEVHKVWKTPTELFLSTNKYNKMIQRCYNPNNDSYEDYGARGIYVCDEWLDPVHGRRRFVDWALKAGYKLGADLSIDRIDNDGPYAPWNCRWATAKEQANNRRNNVLIAIDNVTMTLAEWIELTECDAHQLRWLYDRNPDAAISVLEDKYSTMCNNES